MDASRKAEWWAAMSLWRCLQYAPARAMTMFNITDGKNNISRDKPVEHIDF